MLKQERKTIDPESVRILYLSNSVTIACIFEDYDSRSRQLFVRAPVNLRLVYSEDSQEVIGFVTEPFLSPFCQFDPENVIAINSDHIISELDPSNYIRNRYILVIEAALNKEEISSEDIDNMTGETLEDAMYSTGSAEKDETQVH